MFILPLLIFLAWGSYLNSLGYRLLNLEHFFKARSFCPRCKHHIAWYDNIPVISWLLLKARCRSCKQPISWLYPFIEIITTCALLVLWQTMPTQYFIAYFIFFSALIITIRTDFEEMLISRFATIYLIPIGLLAAGIDKLPLTLSLSIAGTFFGYGILWCTKKISFAITKQDSLGQGDVELLAFIGAFTGPLGCWIALLVGSTSGSLISLLYMFITKQRIIKVPLGAYLSFGAMMYVLFPNFFTQCFF
ncbi:MAG: prepilin peptidase [Candidatus Chromulinivorax sp.]|nr:prepilin peptidase [Candidatus Chromulinivorax sp.]